MEYRILTDSDILKEGDEFKQFMTLGMKERDNGEGYEKVVDDFGKSISTIYESFAFRRPLPVEFPILDMTNATSAHDQFPDLCRPLPSEAKEEVVCDHVIGFGDICEFTDTRIHLSEKDKAQVHDEFDHCPDCGAKL